MNSKTSTNNKPLQIIYWNANGLRTGRNELETLVNSEDVDVILLNETRLEPGNPDPKIPGFNLHRTDRTVEKGGGTAIYVSNAIRYSVTEIPVVRHLEVTGVLLTTAIGPLRLFACYNRP